MIIEASKCTGCGACAAICPQKCITMERNDEGFLYPTKNEGCIACGLCEDICPVNNKAEKENDPICYAVKNKNESIRENSSSGGVFYTLAENIINDGGYVCATVYGDDFQVEHIIIGDIKDLPKMQGAKYAQSVSFDKFTEIKKLLEEQKSVLFVSTPCQVAGLKAFLGKDYENLVSVDMVCHGVPSVTVFQRYLKERCEKDGGDEIEKVNLRSKKTGWSKYSYSVEIDYKNGKKYSEKQGQNIFMRGFVSNLYLRLSCSECLFKGSNRQSDLTLGDYWGIWDSNPEFDDDRGVSLLFVNSEKGKAVFEKLKDNFDHVQTSFENAVRMNRSAVEPSPMHKDRAEFFKRFYDGENVSEMTEEILSPKVEKPSLLRRILNRIKGSK